MCHIITKDDMTLYLDIVLNLRAKIPRTFVSKQLIAETDENENSY